MQLKNHKWTLINTNLRTRTIIQPFAPQSLNDGLEFRRKGTPILWFHWCLFVFIGRLTASFRLSPRHRQPLCSFSPRFSAVVREPAEQSCFNSFVHTVKC